MLEFPKDRSRASQIFTFPEQGRIVEEDPPCFSWIPPEGKHTYTVHIMRSGEEILSAETEENYFVPPSPIGVGEYTWDVSCEGVHRGQLAFSISQDAVTVERVNARTLYENIPSVRPRHLFFKSDIERLCREKYREIEVLNRNIELAKRNGSPEPPRFHRDPSALPYREYFGAFRDFVDRDLVALSLGFALLGDLSCATAARELLLDLCDFGTTGPMSLEGPYGDELGLSMARCLPAVFDLLYDFLDPKQRLVVARTVRLYGLQCFERLQKLNYCENPGNSHAGRLPAYLGEAAMVLKGTGVQSEEEAVSWLEYALKIYGGIFPYFGTPDGGWAEGPFYCTSYTKWFLPFFSAVERYGGTRFLDRPFYGKLSKFLLHFADPAMENHPFGDGYWCHPEDKEWPGFFAQDPYRFYCDRFGDAIAKERSLASLPDGVFLLHLLDIFLPTECSEMHSCSSSTALFPDAGFLAMHTEFNTPEDVAVLARASSFGSDSHRHADQGSFAIFSRGKAMVSPSGYFGRAYGTEHHLGWTKTTKAHNTILVNGVGQEVNGITSRAKILSLTSEDGKHTAVMDVSAAYPSLSLFYRTIVLEKGRVTLTDRIEAEEPVEVLCPIHTLSAPISREGIVEVVRGDSRMRVHPAGISLHSISDCFDVPLNSGVPAEFAVEMPPQYHVYYQTHSAKEHHYTLTFEID